LKLAIVEAFQADANLAREIAAMLPRAAVVASGDRPVAVGGDDSGVIGTGDGARVESPR
jgi:hypothetical protein